MTVISASVLLLVGSPIFVHSVIMYAVLDRYKSRINTKCHYKEQQATKYAEEGVFERIYRFHLRS